MQSLEHDERPWGCYDVLLDTDFTKVKLITVAPNQRLSYQSHNKREENWIVVKGDLTVVRESIEHKVVTGEQTGDYFGEDDIIRYQDDWDRGIYDHLDVFVDRKEKQLINKTDWWKKMSKNG